MALHSDLLEPYTRPGAGVIVTLTALVLFLGGLATAYRDHLQAVNQATIGLSPVETVAFATVSFLVEPVLLFAVLYAVASRVDHPPLTSLLPGLAVAVFLGTYAGQLIGANIWTLRRGFAAVIGTGLIAEPGILLVFNDVVELLVRDLLTAVAALGVACAAGGDG